MNAWKLVASLACCGLWATAHAQSGQSPSVPPAGINTPPATIAAPAGSSVPAAEGSFTPPAATSSQPATGTPDNARQVPRQVNGLPLNPTVGGPAPPDAANAERSSECSEATAPAQVAKPCNPP